MGKSPVLKGDTLHLHLVVFSIVRFVFDCETERSRQWQQEAPPVLYPAWSPKANVVKYSAFVWPKRIKKNVQHVEVITSMYTSDPVDSVQIFANILVFYSALLTIPPWISPKKSLPSLKRSLGWHHPFTAVLALRMRHVSMYGWYASKGGTATHTLIWDPDFKRKNSIIGQLLLTGSDFVLNMFLSTKRMDLPIPIRKKNPSSRTPPLPPTTSAFWTQHFEATKMWKSPIEIHNSTGLVDPPH